TGLVDVLQRRARQLELAGRLQGDRGAVLEQGDGAPGLVDRIPAEPGQALEQRLDAAIAVERGWSQVVEAEAELLVLGPDAPVRTRLFPGRQDLHELRAVGDRSVGGVTGAGHAITREGEGDMRARPVDRKAAL